MKMFLSTMLGKLLKLYIKYNDRVFLQYVPLKMQFVLCHTQYRKKPQFGTRYLKDPKWTFDFNAWDNVEWDEEQQKHAQERVNENSSVFCTEDERNEYEINAGKYWDAFYNVHQNRFFKDRHWLFTEFPELSSNSQPSDKCPSVQDVCQSTVETVGENTQSKDLKDSSTLNTSHSFTLLEVGCGVGNTVFPILENNTNPQLYVYCCDISSNAIEILKKSPQYDSKRCHAFVYNITSGSEKPPFAEGSLDVVLLIFVLSAIEPQKMDLVLKWAYQYLRPGGLLVFRDYGRYDMAQLRFKKGRCLSDNFYVRGDGTRVYFFTQDELRTLFLKAGFNEEQNIVDQRLQVNRGKLLKMYRVWIQAKYRKPT